MSTSDLSCHASGCEVTAVLVYRLVPHSEGINGRRSIWDTVARDVPSCGKHLQSAKALGTVIGARALSETVVTRAVKE